MPQPTSVSVHVNRPLTDLSIAFVQEAENFVATQVFGVVPVDKQGNKFFTYDREFFLRAESEKRAPGSETASRGFEVSTSSYFCDEWGVHDIVDPQISRNADTPLQPERDLATVLTQDILIRREKQFQTNFFTTSLWNADTTPSTTWDNDASTPVSDVKTRNRTMLTNTGRMANRFLQGAKVFDDLTEHPDILDRIKHAAGPGNPATANETTLAMVFGVERVLVARAVENTAAEGATVSTSFINGARNALLVHAPPNPGLMIPAAGYVFSWTGLLGGNAAAPQIRRIPKDDIASGAVKIEAKAAFDMNLVSSLLGEFFSNATAA